MRKRLLAFLLSFCMIFSLLPVTAFAVEDGQLIGGSAMFYYRIESANLARMLVSAGRTQMQKSMASPSILIMAMSRSSTRHNFEPAHSAILRPWDEGQQTSTT